MTVWISHRGLREHHSENTRGAFDEAIAAGFEHLETDLRMSRDGHIALSHDVSIARLGQAAFKQLRVDERTRAELAQVRLECGEPLLFFDEFLDLYRDYRWILDIKPETGNAVVQTILSLKQKPKFAEFFAERCRYLFWERATQELFQRHFPNAVCMASLSQCRRAVFASITRLPSLSGIAPGTTYAVPPALRGHRLLTPRLVQQYRRRGAQVLGYLPENAPQTQWALEAGVDEILTNLRPSRASV